MELRTLRTGQVERLARAGDRPDPYNHGYAGDNRNRNQIARPCGDEESMKPALPHSSSGVRFRVWLGFYMLCFVLVAQLLLSIAVARSEREALCITQPSNLSTGWTKAFSNAHRD